jgi:iron complex outermembrane receptor protein
MKTDAGKTDQESGLDDQPRLFSNLITTIRTTALLILLTSTGVLQAQSSGDTQDDNDTDQRLLEEVTVTGSRIERTGMTTPTPVTIVDYDELNNMAPGGLVESMNVLPQFYASQTLNDRENWFLRGGYGMLNLRGLGINRTLTLLDGRRMTPSTAFGGVDINAIPEAVIKQVETVTGGASAAYGTDAVAGVVNFILDTEYEGLDTFVQGGTTDRSDGDSYEFALTFGTAVGDAGHIILSGETAEQDWIQNFDGRDWHQAWGTVPDANGMLRVVPNVVSRNASFDGIIIAPGSSLMGLQFHPDGSTSPFITSDVTSFPLGIPPARQSITNGGSGQDLQSQNVNIWPQVDRDNLYFYGDWDFSDNVTVYGQYVYGKLKTDRYNTPGGSFHGTPTALTIFQDNAFLPDSIRQTMIDEGLESFTLKRMGSFSDTLALSRQYDTNEINTYTLGLNWSIDSGAFEDWTVKTYWQHGTSERQWYQHGLRVDRIHAAVDAVRDPDSGDIVCRVSLYSDLYPGCQPLNLFGQGNASAAAIDYVMGFEPGQSITTPLFFADTGYDLGLSTTYITGDSKVNNTDYDQDVFEISAFGPVSEGWGAGSIDMAFGYSYRKEEILQIVHDVTNPASDHSGNFQPVRCSDPSIGLRGVSTPDCLNTVGVQYSKVSNIMGDSDVSELFAEAFVPLLQGQGVERMALSLAARWADYSGSGSIWSYKFGLDTEFNDSWRVRATYSRDVRAANMSERFDKTGGVATISDPQFGGEVYSTTRFSGGNPAVAPEEADNYTVGVVWQPHWAEGLSMSLDWWEVDIDGAIGLLGEQAVINLCEAGSASSCELVTRNPDDNRIILVGNIYVNVDRSIARGVDFEMDYIRSVDWIGSNEQTFGGRLFVTYLDERSEQLAGTDKIDRAGQTGFQQSDGIPYALPEWKWTGFLTYTNGPWSTFLQGRYIGEGTSENALVEGVDIDDNSVDSAFYLDFNLGYTFEFGDRYSLDLYAMVTNLTDEDPPVTPYFSAFWGYAVQDNPSLFDLVGRRYTVGARFSY